MVGRDADVAILEAMLDRLPGRGGALLVTGDAGIGKTALATAASDLARARGITVLSAAGVKPGGGARNVGTVSEPVGEEAP